MQIVINIPNAPIKDYQDLYYKIHGMAASEGLFDDKEKSQRALALKAVLDILDGIVDGTPLPKGHGRIIDESSITSCEWDGESETMSTNAPTIIEADKAETENP